MVLEYRSVEELNYYGSDLNKFMNEKCSKLMTVNNIDIVQYKRSKNILRIIESKHMNEKIPFSQKEVLEKFSKVFKFVNNDKDLDFPTLEVYIIKGNYPYNNVIIYDLINNNIKKINDINIFKKFCNFECDYNDL